MLRWWEDVRAADGTVARVRFARTIAPCTGPEALSKRQAERVAWDEVLSRLDLLAVKPHSLITIAEFWVNKFKPEWVWSLKPAGQKHYRYIERVLMEWCPDCHGRQFWREPKRRWRCGKCHPQPKDLAGVETMETKGEFGNRTLRETTTADIQRLLRQGIESGLSVQTVTHWRNGLSALFSHAKACGFFQGDNPCSSVRLPPMKRKETFALTFDQARRLLEALPPLVKEAALTSMLTSMNVSELAGLRWSRLNLTGEYRTADGEPLPPFSVAVREHYYRGQYGSLKTGRRRRIIPLSQSVVAALSELRQWSKWTKPEDPVFAGQRDGKPLSDSNTRRRVLKPIGERVLGVSWVSWHTFRRCAATWADAAEMTITDRMALMGHSRVATTMLYTKADVERRRAGLEDVSRMLFEPTAGRVN
jgi:integrase